MIEVSIDGMFVVGSTLSENKKVILTSLIQLECRREICTVILVQIHMILWKEVDGLQLRIWERTTMFEARL